MLLSALLRCAPVAAWYLPGLAPAEYSKHDSVPVYVNRLSSSTQSLLGLDYYDERLHFCQPADGPVKVAGSLGAILMGDRLYTSAFDVRMLDEAACTFGCTADYMPADVDFLAKLIDEKYRQHWLIDGLPVVGRTVGSNGVVYAQAGFPLGELREDNSVLFYNHLAITLEYHDKNELFRVVGAFVEPSARQADGSPYTCSTENPAVLERGGSGAQTVALSYSVQWTRSDVAWATRWDHYLHGPRPKVNWFTLINSTLIAASFSAVCVLSFMRILRRDISAYNELSLDPDDITLERGWKLVAGDVFRAPRASLLHAALIGTGTQIVAALGLTLALATLGLVSPASRGSFPTALLLLGSLLSGLGGYVSARVYKTWGGSRWKQNLVLTPALVPLLAFLVFVVSDLLLAAHGASNAVPFGSIVAVALIWALISAPLSIAAGILGFKRALVYAPTRRVNTIARLEPPRPWYARTLFMMLTGGAVPFLVFSFQLKYVFSAIWLDRFFYMFGFLALCAAGALILSSMVGLLALYVLLVNEFYHWQWPVFCVSGAPAIYVFAYAMWYLTHALSLESKTGVLLYCAYSMLLALFCFLGLGAVGSLVAYFMVRILYDSIKNE